MQTTVQVSERTLQLLKKIKEETGAHSYDEAITKITVKQAKKESLAGYLGKRSRAWIVKELREKHDRF